MKKLKIARGITLTFEEGCNKYLENCRQRNLREGTINHYTFEVPFCILVRFENTFTRFALKLKIFSFICVL